MDSRSAASPPVLKDSSPALISPRSPRHEGQHHLSMVKEEEAEGSGSDPALSQQPEHENADDSQNKFRHHRDMSDLTQNEEDNNRNWFGPNSEKVSQSERDAVREVLQRSFRHLTADQAQNGTSDPRITLEDLTPTMDQQVEAALVEAMEHTEKKQQRKRDLLLKMKGAHRRNKSSMGESARVLEDISEDTVQLFLSHPQGTPEQTGGAASSVAGNGRMRFASDAADKDNEPNSGKSPNSSMPDADTMRDASREGPSVFREPSSRMTSKGNIGTPGAPPPAPSSPTHSSGARYRGRKGFAALVQDMQQAQSGRLRSLETYKSTRNMGLTKCPTKDSIDSNAESRTSKVSRAQTHKSEYTHRSTGSTVKGGGLGDNISDTDLFYQNAAVLFKTKTKSEDSFMPQSEGGLRFRENSKRMGWNTLKGAVGSGALKNATKDNLDGDDTPTARIASQPALGVDIEAAMAVPGDDKWDENNGDDGFSPQDGKPCSQRITGKKRKHPRHRQLCKYFAFRLHQIFQFRKHLWMWLHASRYIICFVGAPLIGIAALLYYVFGNPLTARAGGSVSWWLILAFRWVLTLVLAKMMQYFLLDCIALRSSLALKTLGPIPTLTLVQSRGWPCTLLFWCIFNFAMLYGNGEFAKHWLFYQGYIDLFNANNQAGTFLSNKIYLSVLIAGIVLGILTSVKRTVVSLYLGRRTCEYYGPQLESLMEKLILVSAVAQLAKEIEHEHATNHAESVDEFGHLAKAASPFYVMEKSIFHTKRNRADSDALKEDSDDESNASCKGEDDNSMGDSDGSSFIKDRNVSLSAFSKGSKQSIGPDRRHAAQTKKMLASQRGKMMRLLETWEEPKNVQDTDRHEEVSIKEILQFRHAMSQINTTYPFSRAFGVAEDRKSCIDAAQEVYRRLLLHTPDAVTLPFETISIVGLDDYGELDEERTKMLVKLFRPDVNGNLTLLDFVKCCDEVYRRFRTFRAAVANSSIVNNAYERIIDGLFYFIMAIMVLLIFKIDVWTLLVSVSSLVVSFAFAFGSAVSKFTEGVLLVTIRKPFDIGDRIHVSNPDNDTSPDGTSTWFVENITLFATTLRFATTNEVATVANGNLANARIINSARSPRMLCYAYMKFGIDVTYEKVKFFQETLESFVKSRPREWVSLCGFRITKIQADLGYVEYVVVLQHREAWQNIVAMLNSKAEVQSFCLEVSKKLNMRYVAPALPVELGFDDDAQAPAWMTSMMAKTSAMVKPKEEPGIVLPSATPLTSRHKKVNTMDDSVAAVKTVQELFRKKKAESKTK